MLSYDESLKILKETNALLEGHFILSSGLHSNQYVQCAKLLSYPKKAEIICAALTEKIKNNFNKIDIVLSPALGGIVVGYEIGKQLNIQTIFAERVDGKLVLRRGFSILQNSHVLVVEDVITTGGSVKEVMDLVSETGGNIVGIGVLVDRSNGKANLHQNQYSIVEMDAVSYGENEIPEDLAAIPIQKPGSRFSL